LEAAMSTRDIVILGCSSQQPTRFRNHGAYLIRWNDEGFLIDPGEGTQRQFIFADIAPPTVTRIFISHFHGDHCLGLGSMLMRLNLDKVIHPIHCYYPASGKKNFDRLRYGCIYRDQITVIEHPISKPGIIEQGPPFTIEAAFLEHGIDNLGYRFTEAPTLKFDAHKLKAFGIQGPLVRTLELQGAITIDDKTVRLDQVAHLRPGDTIAYIIDTRPCPAALHLARNAKVLICESTYLEEQRDLAHEYLHMTAKQAATLAKEANAQQLILTHFSARYRDPEVLGEEAKTIFPNTHVAADLKRFPFTRSLS
jgi:ribonuclease Z